MNSILEEISKFRKGSHMVIDYKNSNRYRVVTIEENGTQTAYYFSTPIYNLKTRKAIDMKFHTNGKTVYSAGSNSHIAISDDIRLENNEGSCTISLHNSISCVSDAEIVCGDERIYPSTNGIAIRSNIKDCKPYTFTLEISKPFLDVRSNDKYFALMSEHFRPFVAISCIGTADINENIISPAKISYQKTADRKYAISVTPCSSLGKSLLIEANLYERKLFQDTTVESKNPKINNAFGSIAFIGSTKDFGEQWLYSRPDFERFSELNDKKILNATLHLPKLNSSAVELTMSKVAARFCSFGSNWNNKIAETSPLNDSQITDHYINLDLTSIISDKQGRLYRSEGFILKSKKKNAGFSVISTGDNCFTPQILEINYK